MEPTFTPVNEPWDIYRRNLTGVVAFKSEDLRSYEGEKTLQQTTGISFAKAECRILECGDSCYPDTDLRLFMRKGEVPAHSTHPVKDLKQLGDYKPNTAKPLYMRLVTADEEAFIKEKQEAGEGYFIGDK